MSNDTVWNITCGAGVDTFHTRYVAIHGWASLFVCIFGSIANGLNIAVLTRKEMRGPTNAILTGLAVADMLVMIEYIPYAVHTHLYHRPKRDTFTFAWAWFVLVHSNFAQVFHTISIWLTVTLAVWRYIAIAYPHKNRQWCSCRRTLYAIIGAYFFCPLICIPMYISTEVIPKNVTIDASDKILNDTENPNLVHNATLYYVGMSAKAPSGLKELNFWIYGVVIKLIPCVALTFLSRRLILALIETKERKKKLATATMLKMEESVNFAEGKKNKKKASRLMDKEKQTDRTTRMLLAVLMLFLLTEFPQGILGLMSALLGPSFFSTCYLKLGKYHGLSLSILIPPPTSPKLLF